MTYEQAKALKSRLEASCEDASRALNAIPGIGSGPMGLTPDHIKESRKYRLAKRTFDISFQTLREFNAVFTRSFRKEITSERRDRNSARLVELQASN